MEQGILSHDPNDRIVHRDMSVEAATQSVAADRGKNMDALTRWLR